MTVSRQPGARLAQAGKASLRVMWHRSSFGKLPLACGLIGLAVSCQASAQDRAPVASPVVTAPSAADPVNWAELRALALRANLELMLARQQVTAAQADLERASLRPNPNLTLSDSSWRLNQSPIGRAADLAAHLDQTIERGGKLELRKAQGQESLAATRWDGVKTERDILWRTASAVIDLDTARLRLVAAQEILVTLERANEIGRRRLAVGDLSEVSAGRITADALRARNDVTAARADIQEAFSALRNLLGPAAIKALEGRVLDIDSLPAPKHAAQVADASEPGERPSGQSPDIKAAIRREAAAQAALDLARAQRTRDVSIGLQLGRPAFSTGTVFGVSASFPLFVFNDYSADIRRADSDLTTARLETRRLALQIQTERSRLSQAVGNARERETRLRDEVLPVARRNADTAEFAFRRGAASVLDVLDAQRTLRSAQLEVLAARADRLQAGTQLALLEDPRYNSDRDDLLPDSPKP